MWKEIMETDNGKEFAGWLDDNSGFYYPRFCKKFIYKYAEDEIIVEQNIINNLAVEWLDSKKLSLGINSQKQINATIENDYGRIYFIARLNYYLKGRDKTIMIRDNDKTVKYYNTRQEAIVAGIKKAFELLENK